MILLKDIHRYLSCMYIGILSVLLCFKQSEGKNVHYAFIGEIESDFFFPAGNNFCSLA